ncbi:MAG: hypothetical protein ACTS3F_01750 [Phycisphaerales bacterium]
MSGSDGGRWMAGSGGGGEGAGDGGALREEVLLGRVVDREASAGDWEELERMAGVDPGVWGRLARAERAHARLCAAVEDAIAMAECVELPGMGRDGGRRLGLAGGGGAGVGGAVRGGVRGGARARGWWWRSAGWAVAACLGVVVAWQGVGAGGGDAGGGDGDGGMLASVFDARGGAGVGASDGVVGGGGGVYGDGVMVGGGVDGGGVGVGGRFAGYSPEDLWSGYVRRGGVEGRVLREMPSVVVDVRPGGEDGMYELVVERRVLERRLVSPTDGALMRISVDEFGQPVMVPVEGGDGIRSLLGDRGSAI